MKKLWPPTYDKAAARFWASVCSVVLNAGFIVMSRFFPDVAKWFLIPGVIPVVIVTGGWFTSLTPLGNVIVIVTNLGFYYFIALWFIAAVRPATNWWPEKGS
jgi:hypothetical protein